MQNTTNYNFNLPEGTDLWNYLTQTNPNFTALDSILKGVSDATITTATEVASGTAHAISRTLPDANVIRFTATSNWTLGDTMTIDGTPVTVVKPNGTNLQTGDYVIGAEVLGVIRSTQFTVYVGGASSLDASDVTYDNTVSGLTATDVQDAIDENASNIATINSNLATYYKGGITTETPVINSSKHTAPADGYVCVKGVSGANNYVLIGICDSLDNVAFINYYPLNQSGNLQGMLFVKKDQRFIVGSNNSITLQFAPLT